MTFLQKALADGISNPFRSCPYKYGYEKFDLDSCSQSGGCIPCWNREMPQKKVKAKVYLYGKEMDYPTAIELRKMSDDYLDGVDGEKDNVYRHHQLLEELNLTYAKKNHDYGDSFHESYLQDGLLMAKIRLGDKYKRFTSLISAQAEVKDESIRDTLMDLANYAIMTVMELDREGER